MASCSSSASTSLSRRQPSTWGDDVGPQSQSWKTFLRNHAPDIAAIDLLVVRTIGFKLLYGLAIIQLERRHLVWTNVHRQPNLRMDRPTNHRGFSLGSGTPIHHPRQRWFLLSCRHPGECKRWGHPRPTNGAPLLQSLPNPPRSGEGRSTKPAGAGSRIGRGHSPPRADFITNTPGWLKW